MRATIRLVHVRSPRGGFTLLELLVVLLILAALAGVLVPMLGDFIGGTHASTGASNVSSLVTNLQQYQARFNGLPDRFDSLIDADGNIITYLPYEIDADGNGLPDGLLLVDLGSDPDGAHIAHALNHEGLARSAVMAVNPENATFDPYVDADADGQPDVRLIEDTTPQGLVVELDPTTAVVRDLQFEPDHRYFVFGVGSVNTAVGRTMVEAPVHFADEGSPNNLYHRYLMVLAVPVDEAVDHAHAEIAGILSAHHEALVGLRSHLAEYYETRE